MRQRYGRELVTIGDVGAFEWGDLLRPHNLVVDLEEAHPWLQRFLQPAPPELPGIGLAGVATIGVAVTAVLVTWLVTRRPRSNPRRRRRSKGRK